MKKILAAIKLLTLSTVAGGLMAISARLIDYETFNLLSEWNAGRMARIFASGAGVTSLTTLAGMIRPKKD